MAPDDFINHALDKTTQIAISLESKSINLPRRYRNHPINKESHALLSLQHFMRNAFIPPILEKDNARTQTG